MQLKLKATLAVVIATSLLLSTLGTATSANAARPHPDAIIQTIKIKDTIKAKIIAHKELSKSINTNLKVRENISVGIARGAVQIINNQLDDSLAVVDSISITTTAHSAPQRLNIQFVESHVEEFKELSEIPESNNTISFYDAMMGPLGFGWVDAGYLADLSGHNWNKLNTAQRIWLLEYVASMEDYSLD